MEDRIVFEMESMNPEETALSFSAFSPVVSAHTYIRGNKTVFLDLQEQIAEFLSDDDLECYWESDVPGLGSAPCVSFRFLPKDAFGNVLIEVYMELDDGSDFSRHTCSFYVRTTRSALKVFSDSLYHLKVGEKVVLNETH